MINSSEPVLKLRLSMPDGASHEVVLNREIATVKGITIGRLEGNDLILDHPSVSRVHARLWIEAGRVYLEDLGSSNGTFIGERRLAKGWRSLLKPGRFSQPARLQGVSSSRPEKFISRAPIFMSPWVEAPG